MVSIRMGGKRLPPIVVLCKYFTFDLVVVFKLCHNTTDAIKMRSNSSNALYMRIVEDSTIFRFEMALLRDLDFQPRLALEIRVDVCILE